MLHWLLLSLAFAGDATASGSEVTVAEGPGAAVRSAEPEPPDWNAEPYWDKGLNVGGIAVNGGFSLQAFAGIEGGFRYKYAHAPHWAGRTRLALSGVYSLSSGSWGGGVALGSFLGPDTKRFLYQVGPDLYFDGYGTPFSGDYHLPWSPGVRIQNSLLIKVVDYSGLLLGASPGFVLDPDRRNEAVYPFHDLNLLAAIQVRADFASFTVGWQRSYNGAGIIDGLILSGGF